MQIRHSIAMSNTQMHCTETILMSSSLIKCCAVHKYTAFELWRSFPIDTRTVTQCAKFVDACWDFDLHNMAQLAVPVVTLPVVWSSYTHNRSLCGITSGTVSGLVHVLMQAGCPDIRQTKRREHSFNTQSKYLGLIFHVAKMIPVIHRMHIIMICELLAGV